MNYIALVDSYGHEMPRGAPAIAVAHPVYGYLGDCVAKKGFVPPRGRWASTRAILRDSNRTTVKLLRDFEKYAPSAIFAAVMASIARDPMALPVIIATISNYDGIVAARGSGALQDVWMNMTANQTPVTNVWYDMLSFANFQPATAPSITAYTNAGVGGAVLDAVSNGSWITNPGATKRKYIVSLGVTVTSVAGFPFCILYDCLWAGQYVITTNATINPSTDVLVTRYASTVPGNEDYAGGNMMMCVLTTTLTHTVAAVLTTTYTNQIGTTGRSSAGTAPATGALIHRVIFNTTHGSATVLVGTPFMPLTNSGDSGVTKLEQVVVSGGTVTVGTINHKIVRPLMLMPFIAAASWVEQDATLNIGNMTELRNVAQVCGCLGWLLYSNGTGAAAMSAFLRMVEG